MYSDHSYPVSSEASEPRIYLLQIVIKNQENKIYSYPKIYSKY